MTALGEQRRTVTALFADLSNFSRLVATVDAEDLVALIDPIIAALSSIVDRHGGYVEKFAGDALLALFGAPVTHEDDALRAVQAACDMHGYLSATPANALATQLSLHVGIGTGPVIARTIGSSARTDYAVLGDAVVLAQRLQSAAGPGETYLDEATALLVRDEFAVAGIGPLLVKGRDEPVPAYRLATGEARRRTTTIRPMVGRVHELEGLLAALADAAVGRTVLRLVTGPAGYGKSQLLAHLRQRCGEGVTTVELAASSAAAGPYRALRPLVEQALSARFPGTSSAAEWLDRLVGDRSAPTSAGLTTLLLDDTAPVPAELADRTPAALRKLVQEAGLAWWHDLAARGPLLVTLDNLQWLDGASAHVLAALVREPPAAPMLVCAAGRETDRTELFETVRIELGPLSRAAVEELLAAELGAIPADRLVGFVAARSRGNPMTARETVLQLAADSLLNFHHGHARLIAGADLRAVPDGLHALMEARLDRLPEETVRIAMVAAAVATSVPLSLLSAAADISVSELSKAAAPLVDAGFAILDAERLRFDSPWVRDVVYARLTKRRRRLLHAQVAAAAQQDLGLGPTFLAEQWYLSGDAARALPLLRQLAEHARRLFEQDVAAQALTRAVDCARRTDSTIVPQLIGELADLRVEAGEYAAGAALFAEARLLSGDSRAWAGQAGALRRGGDYAAALVLLDEALAAGPSGDLRLVWCEVAWSRSVAGRLEEAAAAADAGLALAVAEDRTTAMLLLQRVRVETLLDRFELATADATRAVGILERGGDLVGLCTALRLVGDLQQRAGAFEAATRTLQRGLDAAERAGLVEEQGGCLVNLGLVHGAAGDHAAASAAYARAAVIFEQVGHTAGCAVAYGNRSYELLMLGSVDAARGLAMSALALAEQAGNRLTAADVQHTLGLIAERLGQHAVARQHADAAAEAFVAAGVPEAALASRDLAERMAQAAAQWNETGQSIVQESATS